MNSVLQELLILQERDSRIYAAKEELGKVPSEAAKIKSRLSDRLKALEEAKLAQLNAEKEVKQVDLDRQVRKDTILKLKTRQGETKKNEEYQMLSHEIVRYGAEIDELETKELELMEVVDAKKLARESANQALLNEKDFATELSQQLVERKKNAESALKELQDDRDSLAAKVDRESLSLYERILARRGVNTVVLITSDGQCKGCNMKLPPATLHRVLSDKELIQCSECSRILYNA